MPLTISLLYAPEGADPDDVFERHVVQEITCNQDGTLTIESTEPSDDPYRAPDVTAWKQEVGEALQRHPAKATRLAGDDSDDVHLRDEYHGLEYVVIDTGVEIYLRRGESGDQFAQLWKVLRAIGRGYSCLAFYFDEGVELDLNLRAREAHHRYRL